MAEKKMDLDAAMAELDIPSPVSSATTTSSKPSKPSRFQPKPRGASTTAAAAVAAKPTVKPKLEPGTASPPPTASSSSNPNHNPSPKIEPGTDAEVIEEGEERERDEVEREIDVFLAPFPLDEKGSEMYVMQYPLRPNWQTYEMERRCTEVRMMPDSKTMEVDLRIDDDQQTFDPDMARSMGINKLTLRSIVAPSATDYAVGILRNNQIHLNPINGIVQLRPVIRSDQQKRKRTIHQMDPEKNVQESTPSTSKVAKTEPVDSVQTEVKDESWVQLQFLPESSDLSEEYQQKMVKTEHRKIEFTMKQSDYMGALSPRESINHRALKEAIIRELKSLPLEERLKKWFTEESQLNRFDFIETLLAPAEPVEEVLKQVQVVADLICGVWVTKTSLLYEGYEATVRDYVLLQFSKNDSIPCERLRANLGRNVLQDKKLFPLLLSLVITKPSKVEVKFRGLPDPMFSKRHKEVAKAQEEAWLAREDSIMDRVRELNKIGVFGAKRYVVLKEDKEKKIAGNSPVNGNGGPAISVSKPISGPETRKYLQEALAKIFEEQKVRTIRSVVRDLRELGKRLSALPKSSEKNKHLIEGALYGASVAQTELQNALRKVSVHINGVYVLKPPKVELLSNVFLKLYSDAKDRKAVLRKQEIMQLAKQCFKKEMSETEYAQVVNDLCIITEDGGLMLKSGD